MKKSIRRDNRHGFAVNRFDLSDAGGGANAANSAQDRRTNPGLPRAPPQMGSPTCRGCGRTSTTRRSKRGSRGRHTGSLRSRQWFPQGDQTGPGGVLAGADGPGTATRNARRKAMVIEPESGRVPIRPEASAKKDYALAHLTDSWNTTRLGSAALRAACPLESSLVVTARVRDCARARRCGDPLRE